MSTPQHRVASVASRTPFIVKIFSGGVALNGYLAATLSLLVVARTSAIVIAGPLLATRLDDLIWPIYGVLYSLFLAGASTAAAREYWHGRRRGLVAHALAILLLLPTVSIAPAAIALVTISLAILAAMAAYVRASRAIVVTTTGVALGLATFFYQRMGPHIGRYGTECVPIQDCTAPILGGGYPLQYVVNTPGITDPMSLGSEDEFRLVPFGLDVLGFMASTYLGSYAIRRARARIKSSEARTTDPAEPPGAQPAA